MTDEQWNDEEGLLPRDRVPVRNLVEGDLEAIVRMDAAAMGRRREEYYRGKVARALEQSGPLTSLVAEVDDHAVGFLLALVNYGEFGQAEPVAVVDSVGVDPEYRGRGVGTALMEQLLLNLQALRIERVQTQVDWEQLDLLAFLQREGFGPAPRFCLEKRLS